MIDKQKFIIKLFDEWYTMSSNPGQNIRRTIMQNSSIIFNLTTKEMIKNRHIEDAIPAIRLKMWLGNEIQEFEWHGDEAFESQRNLHYRKL